MTGSVEELNHSYLSREKNADAMSGFFRLLSSESFLHNPLMIEPPQFPDRLLIAVNAPQIVLFLVECRSGLESHGFRALIPYTHDWRIEPHSERDSALAIAADLGRRLGQNPAFRLLLHAPNAEHVSDVRNECGSIQPRIIAAANDSDAAGLFVLSRRASERR
jgi:hypothetical protein